MKRTSLPTLLASFAVVAVNGQSISSTNQGPQTNITLNYNIIARGADHRIWERVDNETNVSGKVVQRVHRYTELASGLHFWDTNSNSWKDSGEQIQSVPGGAAAVQGQHQVYFPYNLYAGVIEAVTPEGQHLKSRPLCLSYFDGTNSVIFATLQSTAGQIVGSNQVIYPSAFTNAMTGASFKADLVYTYKKGSFEQDVVLRQQPPTPESFGLNSDNTRLEALTEFFEMPQPGVAVGSVRTEIGQLEDDEISFGGTRMAQGKAFMLGTNSPSTIVNKRWLQLDGRQILLEEVRVPAIRDGLSQLPLTAQAGGKALKRFDRLASGKVALPPRQTVKSTDKRALELAKISQPKEGFVLDYVQEVYGNNVDYTFKGDTTYHVTAPMYISGTATFEGGAVIKYSQSGSINVSYPGTVKMLSGAYRPVVFTSENDNSIGDAFGSGSPTSYDKAIAFTGSGSGLSSLAMNNFRILYANTAVWGSGVSLTVTLTDGQIVNCVTNFYTPGQTQVLVNNILMAKFSTGFAGSYMNIHAQNCTFDGIFVYGPPVNNGSCLVQGNNPSVVFDAVNCVVANVTVFAIGNVGVTGDHNGFYRNGPFAPINFGNSVKTSSSNPFQTAGGGQYYLNYSSAPDFQNWGTTSIDSALKTDLRQKTTQPPILPSGNSFSDGQKFIQMTARDTGTGFDLGYHYDPIDWAFANCIV